MKAKVYEGQRTIDGVAVTVDGRTLSTYEEIEQFARTGFEWSYEGEAPRQLAFALLFDHCGDKEIARALSEPFMRSIVANFDNDWALDSNDLDVTITALTNH
ncbi:hypothetical protein SAMN05216338_106631 [Bradyrhizobium sp. Rc2d]|uniref:DUF6166 domain-containing protein n=1 Tax=Bradyrhizobium sp. Rc2d TaxID=1855321 RepID=UPI00087E646D|nr:DUF6166 domain-containing protein [Bradyrhizobium sp. Rc2d]SDJ80126.1 hypothetical protein SAMN05216338_106631 [Bradyrhizobium sp. Rc2d]